MLSWFVERPTAAVVDAVTAVVALVGAASMLVLIKMLLRTRTGHGCALALLIASSPFVFDFFLLERRPELLAIPTLVLLGFGLLRWPDRARFAVSGLVGAVFAMLVLMHEAVVLMAVPWALILAVLVAQSSASEGNSRPVGWMMALVAIPPVAALGILSLAMASPEVVEQLRAEAPWLGPHSVFDFLADRPGDALARVAGLEKHSWAATLLVGGGLLILHGVWVSRWSGQHLLVSLREVRPNLVGAVPVLALVGGVVVQFATGEDWLRWCGELGAAGLWSAPSSY